MTDLTFESEQETIVNLPKALQMNQRAKKKRMQEKPGEKNSEPLRKSTTKESPAKATSNFL